MTDYVKAWQCIGCGKIEAPQTWTTPRKGEWERSYLALQSQARCAVAALASDTQGALK